MSVGVSIIVTAHKDPEYLNQCLKSIRGQTFSDFECIVVLDNDQYMSMTSVAKDYAKVDSRFIVVTLSARRERN